MNNYLECTVCAANVWCTSNEDPETNSFELNLDNAEWTQAMNATNQQVFLFESLDCDHQDFSIHTTEYLE